mmetsp:Transcript_2753/g.10797  ORF Transcript_2753/g.10797 Transcript_2753/m.10797 type:complete len:361 (-) Transcript_2753:6724-7806(-)
MSGSFASPSIRMIALLSLISRLTRRRMFSVLTACISSTIFGVSWSGFRAAHTATWAPTTPPYWYRSHANFAHAFDSKISSLAATAASFECCESSRAEDLASAVHTHEESNGRLLDVDLTTLDANRTPPSRFSTASNALTSCEAPSSSSSLPSSSSSSPDRFSPGFASVFPSVFPYDASRYSSSASMSSSPGPRPVSQSSGSLFQRAAGTRPHPSSSSSSPTISAIFSAADVASPATNNAPSLPSAAAAATRTAGDKSRSSPSAPRAAMTMDPRSAPRAASHAARALSFSGSSRRLASFLESPSTAKRFPATCQACAVVNAASDASPRSSMHAFAARSIRSSARIAKTSVSGFSATETFTG